MGAEVAIMSSSISSRVAGDSLPEGEWRSRVECAAGHHLLELYGLTDMVEGVLALRVEGEPDAYLLKPYRTFFDEVRASELIKVGFDEIPDAGPDGRSTTHPVRRRRACWRRVPMSIACCIRMYRPAQWWRRSNAVSSR